MNILLIVLGVILLFIFIFVGKYNKLVRLRNDAKEGFSTMDVYLKKRFDLIPNLVETVKGYANHEKETLENVIQARNQVQSAQTQEEEMKANNMLSDTLKSLFAVSENYPDLKANQNFIKLQDDLNQIELDIANSRKFYNATVKEFNNNVETFPNNIIASMFNFKAMPMYEITNEQERENVKVSF